MSDNNDMLSEVTEWLNTKAKTDKDMYYVGLIVGTFLGAERQKVEIERLQREKADMHKDLIQAEKYAERLSIDGEQLTRRLNLANDLYLERTKVLEDYRLKNAELQKQVDELKGDVISQTNYIERFEMDLLDYDFDIKKAVKDTAKEIFEKIFEALCVFSTQGKSEEYNEGFMQCLNEVDERVRKLAKERGVEVE